MVKRHSKQEDGKYHIGNKKYQLLEGSRAQVWHGTAYKTAGGLLKHDLLQNKHGEIVSKKKHNTAKREKRLEKAGYTTQKGKFGAIKIDDSEMPRGKSRGKKRGGTRHKRRSHTRRRR
tara:strand:- start:4514 stop:4867 length:354 start_codon:yes stop_codon:yes gene_type:complete